MSKRIKHATTIKKLSRLPAPQRRSIWQVLRQLVELAFNAPPPPPAPLQSSESPTSVDRPPLP
jgi:hypothetical protein